MDALTIVTDEVALEGLDGVTLPTLWIRLENREPKFPLKLDECTKGFIWRSLAGNTDLRFYELPSAREDVVLVDRFKNMDHETGMNAALDLLEPVKDIYPICAVTENKDGIQGSCALFKQRTDITKHVRSKSLALLLTLEEAQERYGRKLVVVASQMTRFRALIGSESDPDLKLGDDSYCVLEKVGRARWQGELQRDMHGSTFKVDARKFHYLRKSLVRHQLITMQSYCKRLPSGQQQHSILLLLKRFHVNRRTKYDILMECVSNLLQQSPNQSNTVMLIKDQVNTDEGTFRRLLKYMRGAKLVEFFQYPLEELDPSAGPCTNKNGSKVMVRCCRLIKPYVRKGVTDDDDEDDEDEEVDRTRGLPSQGRIMEKDLISQAYHIVLSCGTKGISQREIGLQLNVGKLESRMVCRKLEGDGMIKGFMEDEGRQRTTKFISHRCVGLSDRLQLVAKERERNKQLKSSAPKPATEQENGQTPGAAKKKRVRIRKKKKEEEQIGGDGKVEEGMKGKGREAEGSGAEEPGGVVTKDTGALIVQPPAAESEAASCSESVTPDPARTSAPSPAAAAEEQPSTSAQSLPQTEGSSTAERRSNNNNQNVVCQLEAPDLMERSHETYRLLKRKNLILEAVNNFKIIEGLFPLQKIINEEEKQDGMSSKCCKKTILRLVQGLSRQGLLKIYTTTVIQDGITKKVDMIVHPSIQPTDDVVNQLIEQVRLKISSSYAAVRQQHAEERARELEKELEESSTGQETPGKAERRRALFMEDDFKPTPVRGLSRTLGFQPKMHRLRVVHTFLWYLIYGHQPQQNASDTEDVTGAETSGNAATPMPKEAAVGPGDQEAPDGDASTLDVMYEDEPKEASTPCQSKSSLKVYVNEASWKRFVPPLRQHKDSSPGWAIVGDLLLCLPLSVYVQIIQVNYKVDGLEEFLNDPEKQHYLIRALPISMKRQLLYKRRYIFVFIENLQKLAYMGLLHFGPVEKFKEKEQAYVYLKRNTTIVDTTSAEPHYWLANESPDKPFERRHYTLNTADDVENFWFDLMCVCLNTPLGVIRAQRRSAEQDVNPTIVPDRHVFASLAHLLKGSLEVCDDGTIPGDGKGAAGLDSEFFGHLKRNWLWTNHLLSVKGSPTGSEAQDTKTRLKSLLSRNVLRIALKGGFTKPRYVTTKRPLVPENVELGIEPASRNQQVIGGKKLKRKRTKREPVKLPRKKKKGSGEPKKRTPAHDEADHKALKMMTRQRVYWSVQEDSLMMLCCVAAHLLNSQLKRPFVPHCVVRDLLHSEFEISLDKTSVSVGRRCHYILKNPQTLLNYRICLAEVYQDKTMMKTLVGKKPADPDKPEDCAKAFSEYIRLLRQKFTSIINTSDFIIPDSKQELFARFKVSAIDARKNVASSDVLTCTADIHAIVLFNLIQSTLAMSNSQMKSSRSFQTFHIYSKYDQELLCQVFIECRKRGLVNRRRVNQPFGPKKNRALPILPMSYQLSHSYYRCFSWRFPLSLCTDSFCFLRNLIDNGTGDARPITTFYHETESRSVSGEDVPEKTSKRKEKQREGREAGEQANGDSTRDEDDVQGEEKPTEEAADDGKSDDTSRSQINEEKEGELGSGSPEASSSRDRAEESLTASSAAAHRASDKSPDVSDMLHISLETVGGACAVSLSLMSLGLLNVHMSIPKRVVVVDTNLVDSDVVKSMMLDDDDDDEDDGDECEGKKKMQVKAHQASHTKFLMMRGYCLPGIVKLRNLNTSDNIVVESCRMRLQLRDTPAHRLFSEDDLPPLDLTKCGPSLLPQILTHSFPSPSSSAPAADEWERTGYTRQDVEACSRLRRGLNQAGPNGLDAQDLHRAHPDLWETQAGRTRSLQQYLQDLEGEGLALRVGGRSPRWVLKQHADPWLLTVNNKQWHQTRLTPDRLSYLNKQHKVPFMRRRSCRQRADETEGPPAKKANVEGGTEAEATDAEGGPGQTGGTTANEEEHSERRSERTDQDGGEKEEEEEEEEEEGEKQTLPEEGAEKEETETTQGEREDGCDEANHGGPCSPPAGSADNDSISFISRPWRMVDGKLNRHMCKGMLEAVLFHVMSRPGITQQALVVHYQDLLQPVVVLDLVQALIDMGCVTKKTMVRSPKPSLFTRPAPHEASETRAKIEDPQTVFYEPTLSCCLRLCQVLPNERHWNSMNTQ